LIKSAWKRVKRLLKPKGLKKLLSILGATIILATFIAKDWKTDKLKDFADSVQTAKNAYVIQLGENQLITDVAELKSDIDGSLASTERPLPHRGKNGRADEADIETYGYSAKSYSRSVALLNTVNELYEKIPHDMELQIYMEVARKEEDDLLQLQEKIDEELGPYKDKISHGPFDEKAVNQDIETFSDGAEEFAMHANLFSSTILKFAKGNVDYAQMESDRWAVIYYVLFGFGWIISVLGILIGEPDEKSVVEEIVEV
jgi:hypothetical protein